MKKLLFTLVLLTSFFSIAQKNYILLKDGNKMEIDERDFYYSSFEKVRYTLPSNDGFEAIKGIDIDKVDKLVSGAITYIPFKYSEKKKKYMVLSKIIAETSDKMLLLSFTPPFSVDGYYLDYNYKIVDKATNTIIDSGWFNESKMPKKLVDQNTAIATIKIHFSKCKEMMESLAAFEKKIPTANGNGYTEEYIAGFMHQDKPFNCN
jgi:hypothetical protein